MSRSVSASGAKGDAQEGNQATARNEAAANKLDLAWTSAKDTDSFWRTRTLLSAIETAILPADLRYCRMPLDTSTYTLAGLRLDGRRWNELRRIHGQISTQSSSDGSSYFEMGNTKILCTVVGPQEPRRSAGGTQQQKATIEAAISIAGFSGVDRKRRGRNDKRIQEMNHMIESAFESTLQLQLYPHSTISITLHVLSQDGSLLAACLNAATLALVDAGIPMTDYVSACTVGTTSSFMDNEGEADPLMDLNGLEENEVPFLTLGTSGGEDKVNVLMMETRVQMARLEAMISVALDGCRQIRGILDGIIRAHGQRVLQAKMS